MTCVQIEDSHRSCVHAPEQLRHERRHGFSAKRVEQKEYRPVGGQDVGGVPNKDLDIIETSQPGSRPFADLRGTFNSDNSMSTSGQQPVVDHSPLTATDVNEHVQRSDAKEGVTEELRQRAVAGTFGSGCPLGFKRTRDNAAAGHTKPAVDPPVMSDERSPSIPNQPAASAVVSRSDA